MTKQCTEKECGREFTPPHNDPDMKLCPECADKVEWDRADYEKMRENLTK